MKNWKNGTEIVDFMVVKGELSVFTKEDLCYWVMDNMSKYSALQEFEVCKDEASGIEYFQLEQLCGVYCGLRIFCGDGLDTPVDTTEKSTKMRQSRSQGWAAAGIVSYDAAKTYLEEFAEWNLNNGAKTT